jgi:uncharacterized integral membrane protein
MQALRTIGWVILTIILVAFIAINWVTVPVNFWPLSDGTYLRFEWPVGFVALVFFLLGFLPMWLVNRAGALAHEPPDRIAGKYAAHRAKRRGSTLRHHNSA